jgi:small subunit ribosomal protein S9
MATKKPVKAKVKKETEAKEIKEIKKEEKKAETAKYFYAVGRRKTSVAQVRIFLEENSGDNGNIVNNKKAKEYFPGVSAQNVLFAPLKSVGLSGKVRFSILVRGGGFNSQVDASRLGISRALVKYNEEFRKTLKDLGFLTRDSREVERKKPGLKKARRAPQWAKR